MAQPNHRQAAGHIKRQTKRFPPAYLLAGNEADRQHRIYLPAAFA